MVNSSGCYVPATGKLPPVDSVARFYLQQNYALTGIVSFSNLGIGSDEHLQAAFNRMVGTSTILQCRLHRGDVDEYKLAPRDQWPQLTVIHVKDQSAMMAKARDLRANLINELMNPEAHTTSLRMIAVRSPQRAALVVGCPHHYLDGVGLAAAFVGLYQYARCPRALWGMIDMMCLPRDLTPSFNEVLLKSDYSEYADVTIDGSLSARFDPKIFRFEHYNFMEENASNQLNGLSGDIADVAGRDLRQCIKILRKNGTTLSSACTALAVKTLAILLKDNLDGKSLLAMAGIDIRGVGKWGVRKLDNHVGFPLLGNYTVGSQTLIEGKLALHGSLDDIAIRVKKTFKRFRDDVVFRMHEKAALLSPDAPQLELYCGCSSIVMPSGLTRVLLPHLSVDDVSIQFGPVPRAWVYVVTCGSITRLSVDIQVPMKNLTSDKVIEALKKAAEGSPLQPFLLRDASSQGKSENLDSTDRTASMGDESLHSSL